MAETVSTMACKPFSVAGRTVSARQIAEAVDLLANLPSGFIAMDLTPAVLPGESFHAKQEALNRLMQRWRKLDLVRFKRGRWSLTKGAWDTLQDAARIARLSPSIGDRS